MRSGEILEIYFTAKYALQSGRTRPKILNWYPTLDKAYEDFIVYCARSGRTASIRDRRGNIIAYCNEKKIVTLYKNGKAYQHLTLSSFYQLVQRYAPGDDKEEGDISGNSYPNTNPYEEAGWKYIHRTFGGK